MTVQTVYQSSDKKLNVELAFHVYEELQKHATAAGRRETGGIIIGSYNNSLDTAIIKNITGPPEDSRSGRTWFYRGLKNLQAKLNRYWHKKQYYLGEWHFHPYASAAPSTVDKAQMLDIAHDPGYQCPEPILLIIGGSPRQYEMRLFIFVRTGQMIELQEQVEAE